MELDEKAPLLRPLVRRNSGTGSLEIRREVFLSLIVLAAFLTFFISVHDAPRPDQDSRAIDTGNGAVDNSTNTSSAFDWKSIPPSRTLTWHKCFAGKYDCARLDVPLDWQAPPTDDDDDAGARVVLAIARLPAVTSSAAADEYRGPIFFNPGGPGGSGLWALQDHGAELQAVVGRGYDIVTFDPRGIGASVPRLACWRGAGAAAAQKRHDWAMQALPVLDAHHSDEGLGDGAGAGAVYDAWARNVGFSMACEAAHAGSGLLENIGTASHARDLREILDQMGEEKLQYWGFSYGTILGGTFAALWPERVGRLVSDGNVDYEEWFNSAHINSVRDADAVMNGFYSLCHEAGPEKCAFYGPSREDIKERHHAILERLRVQPIIYMPPDAIAGSALPELVTYSKIRKLAATALYRPIQFFPHLAEVLAGLEAGDGAAYYSLVTSGGVPFSDVCSIDSPPPPNEPLPSSEEGSDDAFPLILCADGKPLGSDPRGVRAWVQEMLDVSEAAGAIVVGDRLACAGRTVRPTWDFKGPFVAKTSFPILYIANMADNITPLASARNNSAGFEDSVVLIQNSLGHTSLAAPSACTAKAIRAYFQDGILPEDGTRCDAEVFPFDLKDDEAVAGDERLAAVSRELSAKANRGFAARGARGLAF